MCGETLQNTRKSTLKIYKSFLLPTLHSQNVRTLKKGFLLPNLNLTSNTHLFGHFWCQSLFFLLNLHHLYSTLVDPLKVILRINISGILMYFTCIRKIKTIKKNLPADSQMSNQLKCNKYKYERQECESF